MFFIRLVTKEDLSILEYFAHQTTLGMQSLPRQKKWLERKLDDALLQKELLFMAEDSNSHEVAGCSGIYIHANAQQLFYRVEKISRDTTHLPLFSLKVLHPTILKQLPTELCALYVLPNYRQMGVGKLLARCRYLYMAAFPKKFEPLIMARLRGIIENDDSVFWEAVGRPFINLSFATIQAMLEESHHFIAEILPQYPIYANLLSQAAQKVIAKPHPHSEPAKKLLEKEGFTETDLIDLFDAGPVMFGQRDSLLSVRTSEVLRVDQVVKSLNGKGSSVLISNEREEFRVCSARAVLIDSHCLVLEKAAADVLQVKKGDPVRYVI